MRWRQTLVLVYYGWGVWMVSSLFLIATPSLALSLDFPVWLAIGLCVLELVACVAGLVSFLTGVVQCAIIPDQPWVRSILFLSAGATAMSLMCRTYLGVEIAGVMSRPRAEVESAIRELLGLLAVTASAEALGTVLFVIALRGAPRPFLDKSVGSIMYVLFRMLAMGWLLVALAELSGPPGPGTAGIACFTPILEVAAAVWFLRIVQRSLYSGPQSGQW